MRLFVAEKPELARAIAEAIGDGKMNKGFITCGDDTITWCFGHMLELAKTEDYGSQYKRWNLDNLPLCFRPWKKIPKPKSKEQLDIILHLIKSANTIVHAGDPDAEGQLLVDEILDLAKYKGPVKRVLINDNTPELVKKAINNLRNNSDFAGLSAAAEARSIGDMLYGINMTQAYTLTARTNGFEGLLSVGRVQTPILGMIVRRDREHSNHKTSIYYVITGAFGFNGCLFTAEYKTHQNDPCLDEKGRLTDKAFCEGIVSAVSKKDAAITKAETELKETPPPLPYNLLSLQTDAARLLRMKPDKVKEVTQTLREKYRCITYNRSDSEYLSDEQHTDSPGVLAAIAATDDSLSTAIESADPSIKSRAFNSSKVTAHHAIIPTSAKPDFSQLTKDEKSIYHLIARAYVAQFYPPYEYEQTKVEVSVEGHTFTCSTHVPVSSGWKTLFGKDSPEDTDAAGENMSLKSLLPNDNGKCGQAQVTERKTKPRPLYTLASVLTDLTRMAQYVKDETLRKLLIAKDAGKEGEHGGIGTPATRDVIIETLFKRGFIEIRKGKGKTENVVSTELGREVYDLLPDSATYPDMTALWHQEQLEIEKGEKAVSDFIDNLMEFIGQEVGRIKTEGLKLNVASHECPSCGKPMFRKKTKTGSFFWGCSAYPECTFSLPDSEGKPGQKQPLSDIDCPICGKSDGGKLLRRKGTKGDFFGCSRFRDGCKATYPEKDGKPDLTPKIRVVSETWLCMKCGAGLILRTGKNSPFWSCSKYPECKTSYPNVDGKPQYNK